MDHRDHEPFGKSPRLLTREAAGEPDLGSLRHEGRHAAQGVGGQTHIGIDEDQQRMPRQMGQTPAGMLLARPSLGKRRGRLHPDTRIVDGPHDIGRSICGVIVQHDDFQIHVPVSQHGVHGRSDLVRLIAGGDQDGHRRLDAAHRRRAVEQEVPYRSDRRDDGEPGADPGEVRHHEDSLPC
jgi:hypothetical protein